MALRHTKKKCKGQNRANGFKGCGKETYYRTYGLCNSCLSDWYDSDVGKVYMKKLTLNAKSKVKIKSRRKEKQQTAKAKLDIMSPDQYRSKYLQPKINEIARLIDFGHPCIATGNYGKMNGGHYVSVGANRTICLNLHNIFIQSFESNHWKSGDSLKYQQGLIETFGFEYFSFVQSLAKHKLIKLTKDEMILKRSEAVKIIKELKSTEIIRTSTERIELRNEINLRLNIYDTDFCEYVESKKLKQ